jgi:hypothetical protein
MPQQVDYTKIQGWGVDKDPADRPAYPKEQYPIDGTGAHWKEPEQQELHVEVFHSTERPGLTPVFGTTIPPRGLSGMIRRFAYKYSEGKVHHWLLLLFADRVDMVEGIISDLRQGKIPNIFAEMGWRAEYKYNRKGFYEKVAVGTVAVAAVSLFFVMRSKRHR